MSSTSFSERTRLARPLILIRGFGGTGVEDEKRIAYQGFNDGTVYPQKRGENYIYEGLILRFMKSDWQYQDATNVVGYYSRNVSVATDRLPAELKDFDPEHFTGHRIVLHPPLARHPPHSPPSSRTSIPSISPATASSSTPRWRATLCDRRPIRARRCGSS